MKKAIAQEIKTHGPKCSLNHLDISHIRNMDSLFEGLPFEGDISQWDVSKVRSMARMFKLCPFNGDISRWNTESVLSTDTMFSFSEFNGDISRWNMRRVVDTTSMFYASLFNQDISDWDLSSVVRMSSMFMASQFTGDLSKWKMGRVDNLSYMFKDSKFNGDLSAWAINPLASTEEMFCRSSFQGHFPNIDLSQSRRGVMLDATYRGRFPGNYTLQDLRMVFGGAHPIEGYLHDTANSAFQRVHIEYALSREEWPDWMPSSMADWIKSQKSVCKGLDLPLQLATSLVHQQYQEWQIAACPDKSLFDFAALV